MSRKHITFALVATFFLATVAFWHLRESDEERVYRAAFDAMAEGQSQTTAIAFSMPGTCGASTETAADVPSDVFEAFLHANGTAAGPVRLRSLEGRYPVVAWSENKRFAGAYETLLQNLAADRPVVAVSRIGFNESSTEALLCIESSHEHHGLGALLYMRRMDGTWHLQSTKRIWVS